MTGHSGLSKAAEHKVKFVGRNRADAKRKALNYWFVNQRALNLSIKAFSEHLALKPDGKTIIFHKGAR